MDYDIKANLTTVLSTYLIPILVGYGFSYETSNALTGVIVTLIIIGFGMLNERYTSKHLTQDNEDTIDDDIDESSYKNEEIS